MSFNIGTKVEVTIPLSKNTYIFNGKVVKGKYDNYDDSDKKVWIGNIIKKLPAGEVVSPHDLVKYYMAYPGTRDYVVCGRSCKMDRYVLEKDDGGFAIFPDNPKSLYLSVRVIGVNNIK